MRSVLGSSKRLARAAMSAAVVAAVTLPAAAATVINVDFQAGPTGNLTSANYTGQGAYPDPGNNTWNVIAPANDGAFGGGAGGRWTSNVGPVALLDSSGAATTVAVTLYADPVNTGAYGAAAGNVNVAQDAFNLARDYLIAFSSSAQRATIAGLDDNAWYDLYLYGSGDAALRRTLFEVTGANVASQNLRTRGVPGGAHNLLKGLDYVLAPALRSSGGTLTLDYSTAGNSGNPEGVFNGFQLVRRPDVYQVLISDQFDAGGPGSNPTGVGAGFQYLNGQGTFTSNEGLHGTAPAEGLLFYAQSDWAQGGVSSNDQWSPVPAVTVHARWTHQRVYADADQNAYYAQFPGGEQSDFRVQYGIVSANRSKTLRNDLWANGEGGLYVNLFYERETSATDLTLTGNIRAVVKSKPGSGDTEGTLGLVTLATFSLGRVTGGDYGQILDVMLDADLGGWSFAFADQAGPITPTLLSGSLSGGWTNLTSVVDGETVSFSDEFLNGAFLYAAGQAIGAGRGSMVLESVLVTTSVPEPSTLALLGLGMAGLCARRLRPRRRGAPRT